MKKTKYPIVLVHGAAMKDFLFFRSFGKIDRILKIQKYTVYKSGIDGFGTVENNASRLKKEIEEILAKEGAEKVNIIAHSKGGLDAVYMIRSLGMEDRVASLTTLATPHRGSPVASFILKAPKCILKIYAFFIDLAYRIAGDENPDCFAVCEQLRRAEEGPAETVFPSDKVYCQSFSSSVKKGEKGNDFVMSIPLMFSRMIEKGAVTDGLVPRDSAIFGEYRGEIEGSVSHTEIIDFMVAGSKKDLIYSFWSALCESLVDMGF